MAQAISCAGASPERSGSACDGGAPAPAVALTTTFTGAGSTPKTSWKVCQAGSRVRCDLAWSRLAGARDDDKMTLRHVLSFLWGVAMRRGAEQRQCKAEDQDTTRPPHVEAFAVRVRRLCQPQKAPSLHHQHVPFWDVHHPFALLQGEGGRTRGPLCRVSRAPLLAEQAAWALALAVVRAAVGVRGAGGTGRQAPGERRRGRARRRGRGRRRRLSGGDLVGVVE